MKRRNLILAAVFVLSSFISHAQIASEGSKFVNLGLGLGTNVYTGNYYSLQVPPLSVSVEYVIKDNLFDENSSIGVGGYLGYVGYNYKITGSSWKYTSVLIGPRTFLHYQFVDDLDTYTGVMLGYNILSSKYTGTYSGLNSPSSGGFVYAWFIGARYFFSDNLAAMAEIGYGVTYLNIGISIML